MKHIVIITTGGTIALKRSQLIGGAVAALKGDDFLSMLPRNEARITFEEFANVPGSHFTPLNGLDLARHVATTIARSDVDGVVITHGTDTLEETAYLLDLTVNSVKPIVFTGAIRPVTSAGYDGVVNLANAIRVAMSRHASDLGVMVVFDEQIHSAASMQQMFTQASAAFQSPGSGPLGRVEAGRVWIRHRPARRQYIPCTHIEEMVDLLRLSQGADDRLLRHSIADGVAGIVIEGFGSGRVPPWWLPAISDALKQRIAVVIASRASAGALGDEFGYVGAYHDLIRLGVFPADNLSGVKARIKLMVALGVARHREELRALLAG